MKRRLVAPGIAGLLAIFTFSSSANAAPSAATEGDAHGFGEKGQLILTADRLFPFFSYSSVSTTSTQNNTTRTDTTKGSSFVMLVGAEPGVSTIHTVPRVAVDFTVIPHLTVGGAIVLAFGLGGSQRTEVVAGPTTTTTDNDAPTITIFGIAPRVGYILPLGDFIAFWPRGGFAFYSVREKHTNQLGPNQTQTVTNGDSIFSLDLDPQLAIVPTEHFFFHVGPIMNIPLTGSRKNEVSAGGTTTTTSNDLSIFHFGISVGLGGWLSL